MQKAVTWGNPSGFLADFPLLQLFACLNFHMPKKINCKQGKKLLDGTQQNDPVG